VSTFSLGGNTADAESIVQRSCSPAANGLRQASTCSCLCLQSKGGLTNEDMSVDMQSWSGLQSKRPGVNLFGPTGVCVSVCVVCLPVDSSS
jgi:hypothetical protein